MKTINLIVSLSLSLVCAGFSLTPDPATPEKAAVVANDRAYEAAYEKGDAKALADFFAEDADYTTEEGQTFSGRGAIQTAISAGLSAKRGSKLVITTDTVRLLTTEAVSQKGSTTVTAKDGAASSSAFTAIHVKKDGKWKISQLIESPVPVLSPREQLSGLEWLIGSWEETDKTNDLTVNSQFAWARGGNFLSRNVTVKRAGEVTLEGWQIIGWDPVEERLRAWTFDGEGGFSEGHFTGEGNHWLLRETGVTSDGSRTSSDSTFTKVDGDRFTWESTNRTLNGIPQPGISRIEIKRVKGN